MTEELQRHLLGCALFLALVLTTSVAQAQPPGLTKAYIDCTFAAFRARSGQVNDPNLLAEMSLAACPTEEAAVLAWYEYEASVWQRSPAVRIARWNQLKLGLKRQMMEAAKTKTSPPPPPVEQHPVEQHIPPGWLEELNREWKQRDAR
jgi:hypothetical protein